MVSKVQALASDYITAKGTQNETNFIASTDLHPVFLRTEKTLKKIVFQRVFYKFRTFHMFPVPE